MIHTLKVILKVLIHRIEVKASDHIGNDEIGCMRGASNTNKIYMFICFVDFVKVFERVNV